MDVFELLFIRIDSDDRYIIQMIDTLDQQIKKGAEIIKNGGVVAFPTETVYGLGANAFDEQAVKRIFEIKGRPQDNPLIVHISKKDDIYIVATDIPQRAFKLIENFWPGPLTLVMKRNPAVPDIVSAGLDTVAVRMPSHPVALKLIEYAGLPIAAPSANPSGKPSPTKPEHIKMYFGDKVFVIEGQCQLGIESTVIDITSEPPIVLRPGGLELEKVKDVLGDVIEFSSESEKPKSPGVKYTHYKPEIFLILLRKRNDIEKISSFIKEHTRVVFVMTYDFDVSFQNWVKQKFHFLQFDFIFAGSDEREIAKNLFDILITKTTGYELMIFEGVNEKGIGKGIMNRLKKAADVIV